MYRLRAFRVFVVVGAAIVTSSSGGSRSVEDVAKA